MKYTVIMLLSLLLLLFTGCKPNPYPKNPHYEVKKPKVIYSPDKKNLEKMVKQLQGSPYVWAEEGPDRFDCSGFTYYMYGSMGIEIPRVAREQAKVGKKVSPKELQYGDLIFFATDKRHPRKITHVGMYLGDGWFTHASTVKHEVIYSNLFTSPYYKKRLRVCRRYLPEKRMTITATQPVWQPKHTPPSATAATTNQPSTKQGKAIVIQAPIQQLEQKHIQGNFYVQVGSFIGRPKSSIIYNITRHGYQHKIIKFPKGGQTINKLLIGPYQTRAEAVQVLKEVRATIQKDAFIAEIR
jgi:hypothetical protein